MIMCYCGILLIFTAIVDMIIINYLFALLFLFNVVFFTSHFGRRAFRLTLNHSCADSIHWVSGMKVWNPTECCYLFKLQLCHREHKCFWLLYDWHSVAILMVIVKQVWVSIPLKNFSRDITTEDHSQALVMRHTVDHVIVWLPLIHLFIVLSLLLSFATFTVTSSLLTCNINWCLKLVTHCQVPFTLWSP